MNSTSVAAGGRPRKERPPSVSHFVIILLTTGLLMTFSIVMAVLGSSELAVAAGMGAIGLAGDVVRRLLTLTRSEDTGSDSQSDPVVLPPTVVRPALGDAPTVDGRGDAGSA